ncbi:hypothetical protein CALVIDRAFT_542445 [Calocera viscosa TUFC12733]|uniref:Lytic polysaccharide monooxygenase n=1 Tax=Calocera viscosa (strain TUFC12733) TaxID=1330018 RepID=A0A167GLQ1_CALVF|nr:hypothetical protein CALVIDRAFT_542445 [Calocera viscosa TUFC12733]
MIFSVLLAASFVVVPAAAHLAPWDPSMYGFNWTAHNPGWANPGAYDNRPVVPLAGRSYADWWMHGHQDLPPNEGDYLDLPAGGKFVVQMACDKGATDYYASSDGGDIRDGDWPCPNSDSDEFHTKDINDTKGCGFGIAYKSDINNVTEADITIFTVNYTCPWYRYQWFDVPAGLPPCDDCICTFNWIHSPDDGSMQMYQNGYKCKVTNDGPGKQLQTPQLARRCGDDPDMGRPADPQNCTGGVNGGAKQGLYWLQQDGNNMFEGYYAPPYYNALYGFSDGEQTDIFVSDGAAATATSSSSSSDSASATSTSVGSTTSAPAQPTDLASSSSSSSSSTTSTTSSDSSSPISSGSGSVSTSTSSSASVSTSTSSAAPTSTPDTQTDASSNTCTVQRKRSVSQKPKGKKKRSSKKARKEGGTTRRGHGKKRHVKNH